MYKFFKKNLIPVISIASLLLVVAGCGLNDPEEEEEFARAGVEIYFTEAESGDPVALAEVEVRAIYAGETDPVNQGIVTTGTEGEINGLITNPEEITISTLIFLVTYENEEYSFEEEGLTLELTYDEPYDSVVLEFEVDTSTAGGDNEGE